MGEKRDIENIRRDILKRLDERVVEFDGENISLYDIEQACINEIEPYTSYFRTSINKLGSRINAKSGLNNLLRRNTPRIYKVVPEIINNEALVKIYLINNEKDKAGIIELNNSGMNFNNIDEESLSSKYVQEFLRDIKNSFEAFLVVLESFKNKYDFDYSWVLDSKDESHVLKVDDGFMCGRIDLDNISNTYASLSSVEDMIEASKRSKKYGVVYDYIEFYNEALRKRISVNINDLNPIFKKIVEKNLNIEDSNKLVMEK